MTLAGCTSLGQWARNGFKVGPNHEAPPAPAAADWIDFNPPGVSNSPAQDRAWWTVFNDPTLNELIETSFDQNLDLQTAGMRILEARAQRGIAAGNLFPQSQTGVAAYVHSQFPSTLRFPLPTNIAATGFNASWELDFWGRYRRMVEAADANVAGSIEDYGNTLVMLLSEVATNYVQLRTFEERLDYARKNVAIQEGALELAEERFKNGSTPETDPLQGRSNLAQTRASLAALEIGARQSSNRLCVLLGIPVSDLAVRLYKPPPAIPQAPPQVAIGIPADLMRRRPDIRKAEFQVAAQSAQIGVAEADLYPQLTLFGFVGVSANQIGDLFSGGTYTGIIAPIFQWKLLNYGRLRNNICVQDARWQALVLQYEQTVLTAGREVEDALVAYLKSQEQARSLEEAVRAAEKTVDLVVLQYQNGAVDFNRVYTTQAALVTQQDQLAAARGNIALNLIQLYRALGGGWEALCEGEEFPRSVFPVPASQEPNGAPPVEEPPAEVEQRADEEDRG
jgi:NodT family efflux transporter outer membrane factor (OMF) lipoprotein